MLLNDTLRPSSYLETALDSPELDLVSLIPCLPWLMPLFSWSTSSSSFLRKEGEPGTLLV